MTLCDPIVWSTAAFPVLHHLPEFVQTHVHWVGDAIQTSHPLSSPGPPVFNLSQLRAFSNESYLHIRWPNVGPLGSPSVLPINIQDWFPLQLTGLSSLRSKGLSRAFYCMTVWKQQFYGPQLFFIVQLSHPYRTTEKTMSLPIGYSYSK